MKYWLFIFSFLSGFCVLGQNTLNTSISFEQLKTWRLNSLKLENTDDKLENNRKFKEGLEQVLSHKIKLEKPLDSLPHFGVIRSRDGKISLYNWNIIPDEGEFWYYAFMKTGDELLEFKDESRNIAEPEFKKLPLNKWYGCLYYEMIPVKEKGKGLYYILLGWDGYSSFSTRKVIDVLYFDKELNNWFFGKPVFGPPYSNQYRFFIEYSAKVVISLKYHPKEKMMVFDHVVPPNKGLEGIYEFYVPDMSFDAFQFDKTRWNYIQNVDVRGEQTMENYNDPNPGNRPR